MELDTDKERHGNINGSRTLGMNRWQRKYKVLVADDFAEHCILLACAMRQTQFLHTVNTVNTNREAMRYLLGHGAYADRLRFPFPDVLITELGMPCLETLRLLAALGTEGFRVPLRIVLTDSPAPEHRREAARLGADACFTKPENFYGLVDIVQEIERMLVNAEKPTRVKRRALKHV